MKQIAVRLRTVRRFVTASLLCATLASTARAQLIFEFTPGPALTALAISTPPLALSIGMGVADAAGMWSGALTDPITVKLTVDLDPTLPFGVFAAALSVKVPTLYTAVSSALTSDALTPTDISAVSSLQPGPKIEAITHDTSTMVVPSPEIRLGGASTGIWNTTLSVTRPNLKALGILSGTDGAAGADGTLMINPSAIGMFDFTRGDGITPGMFDFTGIAIHELGHLMGFFSGVDEVDYAGDGAPGNPADLSTEAIFSVLDLYRYHPVSLAAPSQPTTGAVNDWRFGPGSPFFPKPYFSVDAGTTVTAAFATGAFHGDSGDQASHFADGVTALMNPGFPPGTIGDITPTDVTAMDAIGWNPVPEPSSAVLLLAALALAAARGRFRS